MAKFKKYDEIEHPEYGRGIIKKVDKKDDTLAILEVYFDKTGEKKQLNSEWVKEHCVCYAFFSEEEVRMKYVEIEFDNHPEWKVELRKDVTVSTELRENIDYMLQQITPGIGLILIGEKTIVAFLLREFKDYRTVEKLARRYMNAVFSCHPDFEVINYDDHGAVVTMQEGRLWHFLKPDEVIIENGEASFGTAISAREELMECCEKKEILGIITGWENNE